MFGIARDISCDQVLLTYLSQVEISSACISELLVPKDSYPGQHIRLCISFVLAWITSGYDETTMNKHE